MRRKNGSVFRKSADGVRILMKIPVFNPTIRRKDLDAVLTCMVDDKLGTGELTDALVAAVSEKLGHAGGVAVRDPGKGMALLYRLLCTDEKRGILLSALSPVYYADPVAAAAADLKLCDVDLKTALIDSAAAGSRFDGTVAAVILTDTLGNIVPAEDFSAHGVPLIRDVTASFGAVLPPAEENGSEGRPLGSDVDYCLLSLEPDSPITGGGGLVITAKNRILASKLKHLLSEYAPETVLSDLNASLARIQVAAADEALRRRKEIFSIYMAAFMRSRKETLSFSKYADGFYSAFPILLDVDAREIIKYAAKKGVEVRFAFEKTILSSAEDAGCPHALNLTNRCLIFPLYPMLSAEDCKLIAKLISTVA